MTLVNETGDALRARWRREALAELALATWITRSTDEAEYLFELAFEAWCVDDPWLPHLLAGPSGQDAVLVDVPRLPAELVPYVRHLRTLLLPPAWLNVAEYLGYHVAPLPVGELWRRHHRWLEYALLNVRDFVAEPPSAAPTTSTIRRRARR